MELNAETDYFKLLEDKVSELIDRMQKMKEEKDSYIKTIDEQKIQIANMTEELNELRETKNRAKDRISTIIEKIDRLAV